MQISTRIGVFQVMRILLCYLPIDYTHWRLLNSIVSAPLAANSTAIASPILQVAPVTTATVCLVADPAKAGPGPVDLLPHWPLLPAVVKRVVEISSAGSGRSFISRDGFFPM